jgi:biopolymer transport protein ExbB
MIFDKYDKYKVKKMSRKNECEFYYLGGFFMNFITSIISAFSDNGALFMWVLLALQIVSIAIILERFVTLYLRESINPMKLLQTIASDIREGDLAKAHRIAVSLSPTDPVARIAQNALTASINMGGREEIQTRLQESVFHETTQLEKRIAFLSVFANLATLLGLLGTIAGLIQAFMSIGNLSAAEKSVMLSNGIAVAMNTTAYGLIIAIPSLLAYAILQNRVTRMSDDLNKSAMKLMVLLGFQSENSVLSLKKSQSR